MPAAAGAKACLQRPACSQPAAVPSPLPGSCLTCSPVSAEIHPGARGAGKALGWSQGPLHLHCPLACLHVVFAAPFLRALFQQPPALGWLRCILQIPREEGEKGTAVQQRANPPQPLDEKEQRGTVAGSMAA